MMLSSLLLAALSITFVAYRFAFHGLPLHMDTAFYVPNRVVARRGWGLFSGWNATFSAGSRLLPQFVHSALYRVAGPAHYASSFRWFYAAIVFATATITGLIVEVLAAGSPLAWFAASGAMVAYLLIASETQYAAYFESAEIFQALVQSSAILLCVAGLDGDRVGLIVAGVIALWFDAVLIKLTGAASASLVSLAIAWHRPAHAWWLALCAVLALIAYVQILRACGGGMTERLRYLGRHERYVRRNYPSVVKLSVVKLLFTARLVLRNPVIPLVAAGTIFLHPREALPTGAVPFVFAAYGLALFVAFMRQGHRVWYHAVPFFPIVAIGFGFTLHEVARRTTLTIAAITLCATCGVSLLTNLFPRLLFDLSAFTRWVFSVYNRPGGRFGDSMAEGDLAVMNAAPLLRQRIQGRPMLVLGAFNQASALMGAAYDTPLASVCSLAQETSGSLERFLPGIESAPPDFVLDTEGVFERYRSRWSWLSQYRLVDTKAQLRLFERQGSPCISTPTA